MAAPTLAELRRAQLKAGKTANSGRGMGAPDRGMGAAGRDDGARDAWPAARRTVIRITLVLYLRTVPC